AVVARERVRAEGPARRAINAGGDRPGIAVLAVDDHGHPLARLVDTDHDVGADVTRPRQQRNQNCKPGYAGKAAHDILQLASSSPRSTIKARASGKMYYHKRYRSVAVDVRNGDRAAAAALRMGQTARIRPIQ